MRRIAVIAIAASFALTGCGLGSNGGEVTSDATPSSPAPQNTTPSQGTQPTESPSSEGTAIPATPGLLDALQACDVFERGEQNSTDDLRWPDGLGLAERAYNTNPVFAPLVEGIQGYREAVAMFHNPAKRGWSATVDDLCAEVTEAAEIEGVSIERSPNPAMITDLKAFIAGNFKQERSPTPQQRCSVFEQEPDYLVESFVSGWMESTTPDEAPEEWIPSEHDVRIAATEAHIEVCEEVLDELDSQGKD